VEKRTFERFCNRPYDSGWEFSDRFGKDTQFDAVALFLYDSDSQQWDGCVVFNDEWFSPVTHSGGVQLVHSVWTTGPDKDIIRSKTYLHWEDLCHMFTDLMRL
jgi:hypothetical protein